jgi:dihydrofolate synthase/folylpolyglutamate synthase
MNYSEAIQYLYRLQMFGAKLGLENPLRLARAAGDPQRRLRFIHVAGTNGKGSTCAMLESIYRRAGLSVGLFTSPHLVSFAERIQINRELIPEATVARLTGELRVLVEQLAGEPVPAKATFFEVVTVLALRYFAECQCELVIWETGLGGRLDATNIVTPLASVITGIDFDHQQWLGETLAQIAAEKAGIIKSGVPVVTAATPGRGLEVIAETARQLAAPLHVVDSAAGELQALGRDVPVGLAGAHQRTNAALAVATVRVLQREIPVDSATQRDGLRLVRWAGRLQKLQRPGGQTLVLDGAHNVAGAEALVAAWQEQFAGVRPALLLGILADKDWHAIAQLLSVLAGRVVLVPVNSARAMPPSTLAANWPAPAPGAAPVEVCQSVAEALARLAAEPVVLVAGSLYLVGEVMERLGVLVAPPVDERGLNEWTSPVRSP